jgi:hypothetical protein
MNHYACNFCANEWYTPRKQFRWGAILVNYDANQYTLCDTCAVRMINNPKTKELIRLYNQFNRFLLNDFKKSAPIERDRKFYDNKMPRDNLEDVQRINIDTIRNTVNIIGTYPHDGLLTKQSNVTFLYKLTKNNL